MQNGPDRPEEESRSPSGYRQQFAEMITLRPAAKGAAAGRRDDDPVDADYGRTDDLAGPDDEYTISTMPAFTRAARRRRRSGSSGRRKTDTDSHTQKLPRNSGPGAPKI